MSRPEQNLIIDSAISKSVLKSIVEFKDIDFSRLKINNLKKRINSLKKKYIIEKKKQKGQLNYKYEIFWKIVEDRYKKKFILVKRSQNKKEDKFNIIFSDFAAALGFIPSLLSLLLFEKEIKDILKYDQFFRELIKTGGFENISLKQKIKLINSIKKGKIDMITPLCPDYEHVYIGLGLYKYTFNKLNSGLGLIGNRLSKLTNTIHNLLKNYKIKFNHYAYYGDFESYSNEICKRVGCNEKEFINKLLLSKEKMKKSTKGIHSVGLLVNDLSSKKLWLQNCKKNEKRIKIKMNKDIMYKKIVLEIVSSRMDLYKSWYPDFDENHYLGLCLKQGAEYASMGDLFQKKFNNPIIFGLDHPKMGLFYNLNINLPVLYGRPKYL